jgi:hypothetical protein
MLPAFATWEGGSGSGGHVAQARLASLFNRMLTPWDSPSSVLMTVPQFDFYFEANLLGNPRFPSHVRFVIATLASLFGAREGDQVRQWCWNNGWPLVWSLGANPGKDQQFHPAAWAADKRLLDPGVLLASPASHNFSRAVLAEQNGRFRELWGNAALTRSEGGGKVSNTTAAGWWRDLLAAPRSPPPGGSSVSLASLRIRPLTAEECSGGAATCVGVLYTELPQTDPRTQPPPCVCYMSN